MIEYIINIDFIRKIRRHKKTTLKEINDNVPLDDNFMVETDDLGEMISY